MLNVSHALVVTNCKRQKGHQHEAPINDIAVKQVDRVGDPHVFGVGVNVVDQGIQVFGEIVGGADFNIGARGGLRCKMGCSLQVGVT